VLFCFLLVCKQTCLWVCRPAINFNGCAVILIPFVCVYAYYKNSVWPNCDHQQPRVSLAGNASSQPFTTLSDLMPGTITFLPHFSCILHSRFMSLHLAILLPEHQLLQHNLWFGPKSFLPNSQSQSAVCWINTWACWFIIAPLWLLDADRLDPLCI